MTETEIANYALSKIGGAGNQQDAAGFIADIDDADDPVALQCKTLFTPCRKKVITDLAKTDCPFRETVKYADLGTDLKQYDVVIDSIAIGASPTYAVTVTTVEEHDLTTADTVFLTDIRGTGGIQALNNTLKTVTVVDETSFTLNSTAGAAAWVHTAETGIISQVPEIGGWAYAFNLPSDCFVVVRQLLYENKKINYNFGTILNKDNNGKLFLTDTLSNTNVDSAYIQYCIDQTNTALWSFAFVECQATLLAAELSASLVKNDGNKRRYFQLQEYKNMAIPDAKAFNQSQIKTSLKTIPNFLGGRSITTEV